jgi:hypothetical protein
MDFKLEIQKLQEKIALLADVKNIIKNESRISQSVELLELVHNRVTELSCPEKNPCKNLFLRCLEYPIDIHWDTKMLLQRKVQLGKELKSEFSDLLLT